MGAGALLTGLTALNKYAGTTAKEQGTKGLDTGGYAFQLNANAGKKQTLLGTWGGKTKAADNLTVQQDRQNLLAGNTSYQNKQNLLSAQNTFGDIATRNRQKVLGGVDTNILAASQGAVLDKDHIKLIKAKAKKPIKDLEIKPTKVESPKEETLKPEIKSRDLSKFSILNDNKVSKFQEGGQLNVIPDGALHARKHTLPEDISEQVTDKGIPVVTYDEGGEITQHAEIEKNEIIFNKETTTTLEELFKQYNETESEEEKALLAIEAGKFLTSEILENTDDRTGLLNEVE